MNGCGKYIELFNGLATNPAACSRKSKPFKPWWKCQRIQMDPEACCFALFRGDSHNFHNRNIQNPHFFWSCVAPPSGDVNVALGTAWIRIVIGFINQLSYLGGSTLYGSILGAGQGCLYVDVDQFRAGVFEGVYWRVTRYRDVTVLVPLARK